MPTPNSAAFTHIIKRDGGIKPFDADKIAHALTRAAQATLEFDAAEAHLITNNRVLPQIHANGQVMPHIEQIQDAVESALFDAGYPRTLRAYIVYREQHRKLRNDRQTLVDVESSMNEYLQQLDWRVNANANQGQGCPIKFFGSRWCAGSGYPNRLSCAGP